MPALKSQNHSSLASYAPPSKSLAANEEDGLGVGDIFSMCSLICFIPFLASPGSAEGDDNLPENLEFQQIATEDTSKQDISETPQIGSDSSVHQKVPAWKEKYIARKRNDALSESSSHSSLNEDAPRSAVQESRGKCRDINNLDSTSASHYDFADKKDSSGSSWDSLFSMTPSSIYSKMVGSTAPGVPDPSTDAHAYRSLSPVPHTTKVHRRQLSPSGVMDLEG